MDVMRLETETPSERSPPKLTEDDIEAAEALLANPDIGVTQTAHRLGVSPATPLSVHPRRTHREYPGV